MFKLPRVSLFAVTQPIIIDNRFARGRSLYGQSERICGLLRTRWSLRCFCGKRDTCKTRFHEPGDPNKVSKRRAAFTPHSLCVFIINHFCFAVILCSLLFFLMLYYYLFFFYLILVYVIFVINGISIGLSDAFSLEWISSVVVWHVTLSYGWFGS